ncbi:tyrosine recombinase XerD [Clostridia bacterium]|nr:tyrosine recombinase XerD [Clostridia bacterium]
MRSLIISEHIINFAHHLKLAEKSEATVTKYTRDVRKFFEQLGDKSLTKENIIDYKAYLISAGRKITGVNAVVAAINSFAEFAGLPDLKVKPCKVQRQQFRDSNREMTRQEYNQLLAAALDRGNRQLWLIMQTICSTGIRVSELSFVTVEAVHLKQITVTNKGKTRRIPLTDKLCEKLSAYIRKVSLVSGWVFVGSDGQPLRRNAVWREMKKLCTQAGVATQKVFPHNLRHLFGVTFYLRERDIVKLAAILGDSDVNTTWIYTLESDIMYRVGLDLGLVA